MFISKGKEIPKTEIKTKIFASYLPQYHETEVNNSFWGKGFTDWVGVKKAMPQFIGHNQPKVPLNNYYYDLSDYSVLAKQAKLARSYGVDGFNIYHYWFKGDKPVLDTPAQLLLKHKEIDISFFFTWDNNSWIRSWSNISGNDWAPSFENSKDRDKPVLLECEYGNEANWEKHFNYLLHFFSDERYLKIKNKPVFLFFTTKDFDRLQEMGKYWDYLSRKHGFDGMQLITQKDPFIDKHVFKSQFIYYPIAFWNKKRAMRKYLLRNIHFLKREEKITKISYKRLWHKTIIQALLYSKRNMYFSALARYDDTPRRGDKANIVIGSTSELFEKYFSILYQICRKNKKEFVLITAWNEWGEGAYLEPDTEHGYAYLEAIKKVVDEYECTEL